MSEEEESRQASVEGSSSGDSEPEETLVAGRAKRSTAGNRLHFLLQNLEQEEPLFEEAEEADEVDYTASDRSDVDLGSSEDEPDDGPPKDGEQEPLQGERELKKQERAAAQKKRKAREHVNLPPLRKKRKMLEAIADSSSTPAEPAVRPRKKSERLSWLPTADDAPVRQSRRWQTMVNKEITTARLEESQKRSVKTHELMKAAAEKKAALAAPPLTQADRLARALKIERENSKSLNRWEKSEEERVRLQRERLEASRNRKLDGPVIRQWSGPVVWEWRDKSDGPRNVRMMYGALGQSRAELVDALDDMPTGDVEMIGLTQESQSSVLSQSVPTAPIVEQTQPSATEAAAFVAESCRDPIPPAQVDFLDGIHDYACQPETAATSAVIATDSATGLGQASSNEHQLHMTQTQAPERQVGHGTQFPQPSMPPYQHIPQHLAQQDPIPPPRPRSPPAPLLREQATRSLLTLEDFPSLDHLLVAPTTTSSTSRRSAAFSTASAIASILFPESSVDLTPAEAKYLQGRMRKVKQGEQLPLPPPKPVCVITSRTARFRDPRTGLVYRDVGAYKMLQRVIAGGTAWSGLLGSWTGIVGDGPMGRVAKGVPEGFWSGVVASETLVKVEDKGLVVDGQVAADASF